MRSPVTGVIALILAAGVIPLNAPGLPKVPAPPKAPAAPSLPSNPVLVGPKGPIVSVPSTHKVAPSAGAPAATVKTTTSTITSTASTAASKASVSQTTTKLVSVSNATVTFVSATGATETHAVDRKTADALKSVTGSRVKVTTLSDGTLQITPLVQTVVARVSRIDGNLLTIRSNDGRVAQLLMSPDALAAMQLRTGEAVTTVSSDGGSSVFLVPAAASNPLSNVVAGIVVALTDSTVTIATGGTRRTLRISKALHRLLSSRIGKRVALQTVNGNIASSLLSSRQLMQLIAAAKRPVAANAAFIASIAARSGSMLTLQSGDGIVHEVACAGSCAGVLGPALTAPQAYYVVVTPDASVQQIVPLVDGTRLAAKFITKTDDTLVTLLPTGGVVTLPCACATMIPPNAVAGDTFVIEVDHTGRVTAAQPFPASGLVIGTVVRIAPDRISIRTRDGRIVEFYCDCAAGRIGGVPLAPGETIAGQLSPAGSLISAAPLDASRRISGHVAGVRDRAVIIESGNGRITVPFASSSLAVPAPGSAVRLSLSDDGTATSLSVDATARHLKCARDDEKPAQNCVKEKEKTPAGVSVSAVDILTGADCARNSGSILTVAVTNRSTGLPVPRANVELIGPSPATWRTSDNGYVEFRNIPAGTYRVQMSKRGYASVRTRQVAVKCAYAVTVRAALAPAVQTTSTTHARVNRGPVKVNRCRFVTKKARSKAHWSCS